MVWLLEDNQMFEFEYMYNLIETGMKLMMVSINRYIFEVLGPLLMP